MNSRPSVPTMQLRTPKPSWLYRWWACDLAPLDDRLRIAVYLLLFWMWRSSYGPWTYAMIHSCPPGLFVPAGIMAALTTAGITPEGIVSLIEGIRKPLLIVWLMSIVGLGGGWPPVLTGLGITFVWGVYQSTAGTGHAWHLPMYTLLVLGAFSRPRRWSLDALIARHVAWWPFHPARHEDPDGNSSG
jgi:hypothetical protein